MPTPTTHARTHASGSRKELGATGCHWLPLPPAGTRASFTARRALHPFCTRVVSGRTARGPRPGAAALWRRGSSLATLSLIGRFNKCFRGPPIKIISGQFSTGHRAPRPVSIGTIFQSAILGSKLVVSVHRSGSGSSSQATRQTARSSLDPDRSHQLGPEARAARAPWRLGLRDAAPPRPASARQTMWSGGASGPISSISAPLHLHASSCGHPRATLGPPTPPAVSSQ